MSLVTSKPFFSKCCLDLSNDFEHVSIYFNLLSINL